MTITQIVTEVQRKLKLKNPDIEVDGIDGPQTWGAVYEEIVGKPIVHEEGDPVDERSEKNISTLHPSVRPYARALVQRAAERGIQIKVISGTRSYAEQNELYEQGRTKSGNVVTNARGGYSNHNFGIAFDIGVFDGTRYLPESPLYKVVGSIGTSLGLEWGGNWVSLVDEPHFQLRPSWATGMKESEMLAAMRKRHENGRDVFA